MWLLTIFAPCGLTYQLQEPVFPIPICGRSSGGDLAGTKLRRGGRARSLI